MTSKSNFERLLAELADNGDVEVRKSWAPPGSADAVTAADRRLARDAHRKSAASDLEQMQRDYWTSHRRAMARWKNKAASVFAPLIKALKAEGEQMASDPAMLQINQANQHHAARARLADFNRRFSEEVRSGKLTAEETAKIELAMQRHAAALDEHGRKLGIS